MSVSDKPLKGPIVTIQVEAERMTKSALVIPDTATEKLQEGHVSAVGDTVNRRGGQQRTA